MEVGKRYLVEVHGWIMCENVQSRQYRIEIWLHKRQLVATFFKPKGKKSLVTHYVSEIMLDETNTNLNRTEIIREV